MNKIWELTGLNGEGRGTIFWNREQKFVDPVTGVHVLGHEGYNDDDDDDYDDFGYKYYQSMVKGTEQQVKQFIDYYFSGEGSYEESEE